MLVKRKTKTNYTEMYSGGRNPHNRDQEKKSTDSNSMCKRNEKSANSALVQKLHQDDIKVWLRKIT